MAFHHYVFAGYRGRRVSSSKETTFPAGCLEQARYGPVDRPAQSITVIKVLKVCIAGFATQRLKEAGLSTGSYGDSRMTTRWRRASMAFTAEVIHRKSWKLQKWNWPHSRGWTGITIDDCWKGWAILLRQKQKKLIMLLKMMTGQPEFMIKHSPETPGAVHLQSTATTCEAGRFRLFSIDNAS